MNICNVYYILFYKLIQVRIRISSNTSITGFKNRFVNGKSAFRYSSGTTSRTGCRWDGREGGDWVATYWAAIRCGWEMPIIPLNYIKAVSSREICIITQCIIERASVPGVLTSPADAPQPILFTCWLTHTHIRTHDQCLYTTKYMSDYLHHPINLTQITLNFIDNSRLILTRKTN